MVENKRFKIVNSNIIEDGKFIKDKNLKYSFPTTKDVTSLIMYEKVLNDLDEQNQKNNQEIIACYDTLTTIQEYVDALLNRLDIQDCFIKDYFEIIKSLDLDRMNKIIMEINGDE